MGYVLQKNLMTSVTQLFYNSTRLKPRSLQAGYTVPAREERIKGQFRKEGIYLSIAAARKKQQKKGRFRIDRPTECPLDGGIRRPLPPQSPRGTRRRPQVS